MIELAQVLKNFTVIVAEDDDEVRKRLKNTLSFYFKKVYEAPNGKTAYQIFLKEKPSLIISDIEMSNGDGIQLVNQIRQIDQITPIIILSAYSKEEYLLKLINLKIDQYILKPAVNKDLFEAISKALIIPKDHVLDISLDVQLNTANNILTYKKKEVVLKKKEKDFLVLLYENKNNITRYNIIQERIWKDKVMTQNALKTFVKELRKKLPVQIIDNVIQEGYKLV